VELAAELPGVLHLQNRDRIAAAEQALSANPRQVLILDDAFQHRRLGRDLDIVLLDALAPFGYERLLPRGLLREPISGLARAHVVALSRSDAVDECSREQIRALVQKIAPQALWLELVHRPRRLVSSSGASLPLDSLRDKRVAAFCGIGNPSGFRQTLAAVGMTLCDWRELPDHCSYDERTCGRLERWLASTPATHVVCTRKDLVKIPRTQLGGRPLWALEIRLEIVSGRDRLEPTLASLTSQSK
jgi:tetraacyldisaccharide 4'-kinase